MPARVSAADSALIREAKDLYFEQRQLNLPSREAIDVISGVVGVEVDKLIRWAINDDWEEQFERSATVAQFNQETLRPEHQLSALIDSARSADTLLQKEMAVFLQQAEDNLPLTLVQVQKMKLLQDSHAKALAAVDRKAIEVQRRSLEIRLRPEAKQRYEEMVGALRTEYEGRGPQYEMLIQGTVRVHIYLDEMSASGRAFTLNEFESLSRLHMNYIERLQHYTEATKTEVFTKALNLASMQLIEMAEREFKDIVPDRWANFLQTVAAATGHIIDTPAASGQLVAAALVADE